MRGSKKQHIRVGDVIITGDADLGRGITTAQRQAIHASDSGAPTLAMCAAAASEFCETCDAVTIWSWLPDRPQSPNPRGMFQCNGCQSQKPIRIGAG